MSKITARILFLLLTFSLALGRNYFLPGNVQAQEQVVPPGTCQLRETQSNQTLFEFSNPLKLLADREDHREDGPFSFNLVAGRYKLTIASYDEHIGLPPQYQDQEYYSIRLYDSAGTEIGTSNHSEDLLDSENYKETVVNDEANPFIVNRQATQISAVHPLYYFVNANSIFPVCVLFEKLPEGTPTPSIGPATPTPTQTPTPTPTLAPTITPPAGGNPWFQTDKGDIRFRRLVNDVPDGEYTSDDTNYPGVLFSSDFNAAVDANKTSPKDWIVNDEYSTNSFSSGKSGTLSFSFYKAKARQEGVPVLTTIPNTIGGSSSFSLSGNNVYELPSGDMTINTLNIPANSRVVILVNEDVIIRDNITVPSSSLLVVASKGNIEIDPSVEQINGYFSSEKSIFILSNASCPATPDDRLLVRGVLVANSRLPFESDSSGGKVDNRRDLCGGNISNPSLRVESRLSFLSLLTDFYKTTYSKWEEVKP